MSTTWTLTRERICDKALEKCGVLGQGETADAADRTLCLEALDGILKTLPWFGYAWPKTVSAQATLTLTANVNPTAFPADYYGNALLSYLDASGNEIQLPLVSLEQWDRIINKSASAAYPLFAYLDRLDNLYTWPLQNANVTAKLSYQQIIDDSVAGTAPDVTQGWLLALPWGVAAEVMAEFGTPLETMQVIEGKWKMYRELGVQNTSYPPAQMQVDD